ncbi:GNAT family N-acetyltransferase [Sphingobacterium multivorum]|uniref:GNAT family N-acetyltransferase n=1 Tax=Sphingobacterium multivorum TaxID=28454 RepID=UPI0028A88B6B|nr:GNAT family N-acetyltransferase [Sphingobacterium multivorum]
MLENIITFNYVVDKPQNLSEQQRIYFREMLTLQGQVTPTIDKINSCHYLCIVYDNETPIGIGAIKNVYKTPFNKAKIETLKDKYDFELGYIFVCDNKQYRNKGIASKICSGLLNMVSGSNVFATTEESNKNPMKFILQKFNFKKTGKTYKGIKTKKDIGLYLLTQ